MKRLIVPAVLGWSLTVLMTFSVVAQADSLPDFTELVEDAAPGVVNISTTRTLPNRSSPSFHGFSNEDIRKFSVTFSAIACPCRRVTVLLGGVRSVSR